MLTPSPAWAAAFESDGTNAMVIAVLKLEPAEFGDPFVEGVNQFTFVSAFRNDGTLLPGVSPTLFAPVSLARIGSFSAELDPIERTVSIGQTTIEFIDDGTLRDLLAVPTYLKGRPVDLYLGTPTMSLSECLPIGHFLVSDLRVLPNAEMHLVINETKSKAEITPITPALAIAFLGGSFNQGGNFVCMHPLDVIVKALKISDVADGLLADTLTDTSLRDHFGHLCVSRYTNARLSHDGSIADFRSTNSVDGGIDSNLNARDLINEMEKVVNGTVRVNSDGLFGFQRYDRSRPVDAVWDSPDDILDLEIPESWTGHINKGRFEYARGLATSGLTLFNHSIISDPDPLADYVLVTPSFELRDTASQARYSGDYATAGIYQHSFSTDWLNGIVVMDPSSFSGGTGSGATAQLIRAAVAGFSGCRFEPRYSPPDTGGGDPYVLPDWAKCRPPDPPDDPIGQLAYIRITGYHVPSGTLQQEIASVDDISVSSADGDNIVVYDRDATVVSGVTQLRYLPYSVSIRLRDRGLFGTTAIDWGEADGHFDLAVEDLTAPVLVFGDLIRRACDGLTMLRVTTPISKAVTEVGDFVSLKDQRGVLVGHRTIDTDLIWEVLKSEVVIFDGEPRCQFMLGLVNGSNADDVTLIATPNYWYQKTS